MPGYFLRAPNAIEGERRPGQGAMLVRDGVHLIPDWERAVTPVVDAVLARADVDPSKVVLQGWSLGGVSDRMGHANMSVTFQIYGHRSTGRDREAADLVGELIHRQANLSQRG